MACRLAEVFVLAAVFAAVAAASAGEGMGKSEDVVAVVLRAVVTMPEMVGLAWLSTLI